MQKFKEIFGDNPKHAKELLAIISNSKGLGNRFEIRDKIAEINDSTNSRKKNSQCLT